MVKNNRDNYYNKQNPTCNKDHVQSHELEEHQLNSIITASIGIYTDTYG